MKEDNNKPIVEFLSSKPRQWITRYGLLYSNRVGSGQFPYKSLMLTPEINEGDLVLLTILDGTALPSVRYGKPTNEYTNSVFAEHPVQVLVVKKVPIVVGGKSVSTDSQYNDEAYHILVDDMIYYLERNWISPGEIIVSIIRKANE